MARARGGARVGAGRPPSSPTGQRRTKVAWTIAPNAIARVQAEAEQRGVSPSSLVEEWALSLGGGSLVHSEILHTYTAEMARTDGVSAADSLPAES